MAGFDFSNSRVPINGDAAKQEDTHTSTASTGIDKATLPKAMQVVGTNIWENITDEERQNIGFNRANITFVNQLGSLKYPASRTVTEGRKKREVACYKVVGIKLRTSIDIKVPSIPFKDLNRDLRQMESWDDIKNNLVEVKAGSTFVLTRIEALYFFVMAEFGLQGFCSYNNNPKGVRLSFKITKDIVAADGYVTPCWFNDTSTSPDIDESLKVTMELVDRKVGDTVELLPEYAEKFAALYPPKRGAARKDAETAEKGVLAMEYCLKSGGYSGLRQESAKLMNKNGKRR